MNKQNNMKGRQRVRTGAKPRPQGGRNPNYDGGGGNNRMRGNAQQLLDKYLAMARDATLAGHRVLAENYFQHADHYYRVVNARLEQQGGRRPQNDDRGGHQNQNQNNGQSNRGERGDEPAAQSSASSVVQSNSVQSQPVEAQSSAPTTENVPLASSEADIGLPPGLHGAAPAAATGDAVQESDAPVKPAKPRQPTRRRRSPSDKPSAAASTGK
jgi:hypothetical protein